MSGLGLCLSMALAGPALAGDGAGAGTGDGQEVPGPWENHQIELPGRAAPGRDGSGPLNVHYLVAGPEDAPRVLLLHGFPDTSYGWRYVLPLLSQDFRVYAPDLRGYAGTDKPRTGYDLASLSGDVLAFLDAVGAAEGWDAAEPVHLLGHDWGASVGWRVVTEHPERFSSWTALAVPPLQTLLDQMEASKEQRRYKRFLAQLVSPFSPVILAHLSEQRRGDLFYREELVHDEALRPEDLSVYQASWDERRETIGPIRYYRQIVFHGREVRRFTASAPKVSVPSLVVFGAEDHYMLPPMAALSCQQVSARCQSAVFEGSGHYVHWERPGELVSLWRSFIE